MSKYYVFISFAKSKALMTVEERLDPDEKYYRKQIDYAYKCGLRSIKGYYDDFMQIIKDKNRLFNINFNDSLGFNLETYDDAYYNIEPNYYLSSLSIHNKLLKQYYKDLYRYYQIMEGKGYAINKYEQPLFKIGIPYDVVRLILSYLLKL